MSRAGRSLHQAWLLALLAASGVELQASAPSAGRQTPQLWARLPTEVAEQVHFTTAELPGVPLEADSLRGIKRWPKTMVLDGILCRLQIHRGQIDGGPVDPGVPDPYGYFEAFYVGPGERHETRGPHYVWLLADSTLTERGYRTPSGGQIFAYDAKGRLRGYSSRTSPSRSWLSCGRGPNRVGLHEWFGDRGQLVGFQMGDARYWRGVERTRDEYSEISQRWNRGLPARGRRAPSSKSATWDSLPQELRPLIHASPAEIPALPAGGEALNDPRRWPATWLVEGQVYRRFYVEYHGSMDARDALQRFEEIRPQFNYGAYYSADGRRSGKRGPAFTWLSNGTLARREYRTRNSLRAWLNDEDGRLVHYRATMESGNQKARAMVKLVTDEWYSSEGELVGYESDVEQVSYWRGRLLSRTAYSDSLRSWLPGRDEGLGRPRLID